MNNEPSFVTGAVVIVLVVGLYFLPSFLAYNKSHLTQIFFTNLLLGWTILGWIVALIWALKNEARVTVARAGAFCTVCGKYSQPGSKFCSACGLQISA